MPTPDPALGLKKELAVYLRSLLLEPAMASCYRRQVVSDLTDANITFAIAVEDFRVADSTSLPLMARKIMDTYFSQSNTEWMMQTKKLHQLSEEVKMHKDRVKLTTFDAAQAEALDMMAGAFLGHVEEV